MKIVILILGFTLGVIAGVMFSSDSNLVLAILLLVLGAGSVGYTIYLLNKVEEDQETISREYNKVLIELQDTQQALSKCIEDQANQTVRADGGSLD